MIFKKLFLLLSFIGLLHAQPSITIQEQTGSYLTLSSTQATKAWIGLYQKGTSTDWENVLAWKWVTGDTTKIQPISFINPGDYEARLFYNNSYTVETFVDFTVGESPGNAQKIVQDATSKGIRIDITLRHTENAQASDWVGVFKKGLSQTRANLLAWSYVNGANSYHVAPALINNTPLQSGVYDIVYFKTNSYHSVGKQAILTVENNYSIQVVGNPMSGTTYAIELNNYAPFKQAKDWVAIFKEGDAYTRENILYWSYIQDQQSIVIENIEEKLTDKEAYTVVLFSKDSYSVLKTSNFVAKLIL